jgi:SAM-dependent methyltransferase
MKPPFARLRTRLNWFFPTMRNVLVRRSLAALDLRDIRSVLVVGAGEDPYRHLFPESDTYVRSDLVARPGRTDVVADASALPFRQASFQCVVATEVLEYIPQPHPFATELYRILSDEGLALVTVPFVFQDHGDYWRPTRRALGDLFRRYSSVRIYAQGNRLHTMIDLLTTAFSPYPVLFPLRALSNLQFLAPGRLAVRSSRSTAPGGFLIVARK